MQLEDHPDFQAALRARTQQRRFPGRAVVRHLFVPSLLGASAWALLQRPTVAFVLPLAVSAIWFLEQLYPLRPEWNARPFTRGAEGARALAKDLLYLVGVTALTAALIDLSDRHWKPLVPGLHLWPRAWPLGLKALLAFLVVELASYVIHRIAHRVPLLWQFHSTHHVVTELNAMKALRTHPVDNLVFHVFRVLPLVLLGAGLQETVVALSFGAVLGVLAHANLDLADRGWSLFFNLPRAHAAHHSASLEESNSNFGCHTVVYDRLFRTYRAEPAADFQIGVLPLGPRTLWQELAWPFYRSLIVTPPGTDPRTVPGGRHPPS